MDGASAHGSSRGAVYQVEPVGLLLIDGLTELARHHWREVGLDHEAVPLNPDWNGYQALEDAGLLKCISCRVGDRLAGYIFWFVRPHLHYRTTLYAICDMFYVAPEFRRGRVGINLFVESERTLRAMGVRKAMMAEKLHMRRKRGTIGRMFRRLGWTEVEANWSKLLGE